MVKEKKQVKEQETKLTEKKTKKVVKKAKVKKPKDTITFKSEVSKIKWPSKKQMVKYSIATIVFVIFFAAFFYVIELIMALLKTMI